MNRLARIVARAKCPPVLPPTPMPPLSGERRSIYRMSDETWNALKVLDLSYAD